MSRNNDVKIRILSEYYEEGSKAAERATRRLAAMQMAANREMAASEAQRASEVAAANSRQLAAMETFGRGTLAVTAAVAVGLGLSAKAAMDWESAWAGVTKTVDGSPEQMAALEAELRGLAKTLPATHEEIAGVAEAAGQLGVKRQDVAAFTRTMIDMGETTNLTADEAATSMAQLSNIMGISAGEASKLGSTIVALGNNGASTERDILAMGLRIAGAGRTVGMTADQVLAFSSALSSVGIEAEAGGTAISRVMLQIDNDVATGSDRLEQYAAVAGVSADEFATKWRDDAAGALQIFLGGLGQMRADGENTTAVLDEMGFAEVRVSDALRRASLSSDLVTDSLATGNKAWEENLALTEEAAKRYETAESRLQIARNQINDAAIDIGGNFLPAVASAAEATGSLAVGFGQLPAPVQTWVANLGGAALGLTGIVGGAAVAIPKLHELRTTLDTMSGGSSRAGRAIGGVASFLTGPWGLALAGATIAVGAWMKAQGEAAQVTQALSSTLDQQTGALTNNTDAWIAEDLARQQSFGPAGIGNMKTRLEAMREMGLSVETITAAWRGNKDAVDEVVAAAERYGDENTWSINAQNQAYQVSKAVQDQAQRLEEAAEMARASAEVNDELAESQGGLAGQTTTTTAGLDEQMEALRGTGDEAAIAEEALSLLSQTLDDLNSASLDARDAERQFREAIDEVAAAAAAATEEGLSNAEMLDINTEAGRKNQAILDGLARDGIRHSQAVLEQTGSEEQFRAALDQSRTALYNAAIQMGMTEEAAWQYVDSVLAVPDEATTTAHFEAVEAEARMQAFVNKWSGYNIPITANLNASAALAAIQRVQRAAGAPVMEADGGVLQFFANGSEHHVAQIAPAGAWRVWAEPETGGEAYIPLSPSKRGRSEAILEDVAARFGMYVGRYADGAVVPGAATGARTGTVQLPGVTIGHVTVTDVGEMARVITERQRDAAALHNISSIAVEV
ncbi:hypothetical protein N866_07200 [Actinotalea ferrariae CF5-4]|uniref:Phage tail tape measure protein domain-containing protein n=1 Tax=Actinotalea ferrariae CF5-4 TaxID=948458 RepID=A0A021VU74_9CELL|nr:phage tail tape measure protein [Actinotalea ferrariae]EYR64678.1 hypothetical protein N866_07200 [Actinotalea ferrariae CF5-4]